MRHKTELSIFIVEALAQGHQVGLADLQRDFSPYHRRGRFGRQRATRDALRVSVQPARYLPFDANASAAMRARFSWRAMAGAAQSRPVRSAADDQLRASQGFAQH